MSENHSCNIIDKFGTLKQKLKQFNDVLIFLQFSLLSD